MSRASWAALLETSTRLSPAFRNRLRRPLSYDSNKNLGNSSVGDHTVALTRRPRRRGGAEEVRTIWLVTLANGLAPVS